MSDELVKRRVGKMLETAAMETDYRVKWARVNRAAGMVASFCAIEYDADPVAAGAMAQDLVEGITNRLSADLKDRNMVTVGLAKRVGAALYEWYTGRSEEL